MYLTGVQTGDWAVYRQENEDGYFDFTFLTTPFPEEYNRDTIINVFNIRCQKCKENFICVDNENTFETKQVFECYCSSCGKIHKIKDSPHNDGVIVSCKVIDEKHLPVLRKHLGDVLDAAVADAKEHEEKPSSP